VAGIKDRGIVYRPPKEQAAYFRERAAEARAKAEAVTDYEARATMLHVADNWEVMALVAERFPSN
jgi:hypothetical protein